MPADLTPAQARLIALYLPQFIPFLKTTTGGERGLQSGQTWPRRSPSSADIGSLAYPPILASMIYACPRSASAKPIWRGKPASLASATGIIGLATGAGFWNDRLMKSSPRVSPTFLSALPGQTRLGAASGTAARTEFSSSRSIRVRPMNRHTSSWCCRPSEIAGYMKVDGKPIFVVLDLNDHPALSAFIRHWRQLAESAGLPGIYFIAMWNQGPDPKLNDFDAVSEYGPGDFLETLPEDRWSTRLRRWRKGEFGPILRMIFGKRLLKPQRHQYTDVIKAAFTSKLAEDPRYIPTVLPGWDNTPRSGQRGIVFEGATPALFATYLKKAINLLSKKAPEEKIIFLKAWNEWAEGNYVEPDREFGHQYLDAIRKILYRK